VLVRAAAFFKGGLSRAGIWGLFPQSLKSGYANLAATPYTDGTAAGPGKKGVYTWLIHMYPPKHNAGAEWMAHAMNTYLVRKKRGEANVVVNENDVDSFEQVPLINRSKAAAVHAAVASSSVLLSHLDMEPCALKTARLCRKPLVLVVHNSFRYSYLKKFKKRLPGNLYLIHNSKWIEEFYTPLGLPSIVVHPPVDADAYATASSREYVTLVNLSKDKGGAVFREIARRMPDTKFLGVKGAYEEQIVTPLGNVTIVENTPNIKEIYGRSAIVLMPSMYESWGRVAVEAMASGIPVVAHPTNGLKESCSYAGIYCDRDEPEEWVGEIRRLQSDPAYYEQRAAACRRRARELDPQSQLASMADWLERLRWNEPATEWSKRLNRLFRRPSNNALQRTPFRGAAERERSATKA